MVRSFAGLVNKKMSKNLFKNQGVRDEEKNDKLVRR